MNPAARSVGQRFWFSDRDRVADRQPAASRDDGLSRCGALREVCGSTVRRAGRTPRPPSEGGHFLPRAAGPFPCRRSADRFHRGQPWPPLHEALRARAKGRPVRQRVQRDGRISPRNSRRQSLEHSAAAAARSRVLTSCVTHGEDVETSSTIPGNPFLRTPSPAVL